eukprot:g448.t1
MDVLHVVEAYLDRLEKGDTGAVLNIQRCVEQEMNPNERSVLAGLLLDGNNPKSLVNKVDKMIQKGGENDEVRLGIVKFLGMFVQLLGAECQPYGSVLIRISRKVIRADRLNKVKSAAFDVLQIVLKLQMNLKGQEHYIQPTQLITTFFQELNMPKSKLGQTTQSQKLAILYMETLNAEINNKSSSTGVQRQLVRGIFEGLTYFLHNFAEYFPMNAQKKVMRLTFLFENVTLFFSVELETRYDIFQAAAKLFCEHAQLFAELMVEKCEFLLARLMVGCQHVNNEVRKLSFNAVELLVATVTRQIVARPSQQGKSLFLHFVRFFHTCLDDEPEAKEGGEEKKIADLPRVQIISMSIRAMGQLGKGCREYLSLSELHALLMKLLLKSEEQFAGTAEQVSRVTYHLPSYLTAFANLLHEIPQVDLSVLPHLTNIIGRLFMVYPTLPVGDRRRNDDALLRLFVVVHSKGIIFSKLLEQVVSCGLRNTISELPSMGMEAALLGKERKAWREYCSLWHRLLGVAWRPYPGAEESENEWRQGLSFSDKEAIQLMEGMQRLLFDHIIAEILSTLKRLNLVVTVNRPSESSTAGPAQSDPNTQSISQETLDMVEWTEHHTPAVPKDFRLFLNMTSFVQFFLLAKDVTKASSTAQESEEENPEQKELHRTFKLTAWFIDWLLIFCQQVIEQAFKHPKVSGWNKLIAVVLLVCQRHDYFKSCTPDMHERKIVGLEAEFSVKTEGEDTAVKMEVDEQAAGTAASKSGYVKDPNLVQVHALLRMHLQQVLVQLRQQTDELLFSGIQLVLSAPLEVLELPRMVPALSKAFVLGRVHPPAAEIGMKVLEDWTKNYPLLLRPHLPTILPQLCHFLRSEQTKEAREQCLKQIKAVIPSSQAHSKTGVQGASKKSAILYRRRKGWKGQEDKSLSVRILEYLGSLGGHAMAVMDTDEKSLAQLSLVWDTVRHVQYPMPFPEDKLDVNLDNLLPRITYLAEQSSDRKTRVSACESLHAIIIYMIATRSQDPNRDTNASIPSPHKLYHHICPVTLRLATGAEPVANQLFEPLVRQLIHYFVNENTQAKESFVLLDAVMDAVGNAQDGKLRQFAATCMAEFLSWSLKKGSVKETDKGKAVNAVSLLRKLYSLLHHPDPYKRLGACLSFTEMRTYFRENDELISKFTLDLLQNMIRAAKLAENDDPNLGTREATQHAMSHLVRVLTDQKAGKYRLLLYESKDKSREGDEHCQKLGSFTKWVFTTTTQIEDNPRRLACYLFPRLVLETKQAATLAHWLEQNFPSIDKLCLLIERGDADEVDAVKAEKDETESSTRKDPSSISLQPPEWLLQSPLAVSSSEGLTSNDRRKLDELRSWLRCLASVLDSYHWFIEHRCLPSQHTPDDLLAGPQAKTLPAVAQFLTHVANNQAMQGWAQGFGVNDFLEYQLVFCNVTIRLFRLAKLLLTRGSSVALSRILSDAFFRLLVQTLLDPTSRGFSGVDTERVRDIQKTIGMLLSKLVKHETYKNIMVQVLRPLLDQSDSFHFSNVEQLCKNLLFTKALLEGYYELNTSGFLKLGLEQQGCIALGKSLRRSAFELATRSSEPPLPLEREAGREMLRVSLHLLGQNTNEDKVLFNLMTDTSAVPNSSAPNAVSGATRGQLFYTAYRRLLESYLLHRFSTFSKALVRYSATRKEVWAIFLGMMKEARRLERRGVEKKERLGQVAIALTQAPFEMAPEPKGAAQPPVPSLGKIVPLTLKFFSEKFSQCHKKPLRFPEQQFNLAHSLELLEIMLELDRKTCLTPDLNPSFAYILDIYCECMGHQAPLGIKLKAIAMLPSLLEPLELGGPVPMSETQVLNAVKMLVTSPPFPAHSSDLRKGTVAWKQYVRGLDAVLQALGRTHSFPLLLALLPLLREHDHPCQDTIRREVGGFVSKMNQPGQTERTLAFLTQATEHFLDHKLDKHELHNARRFLCAEVVVPLLKHAAHSVLVKFFNQYGKKLWGLVADLPAGPNSSRTLKEQALEALELEGIYSMLEVMYKRLEVAELPSTGLSHKDVMRVSQIHVKRGTCIEAHRLFRCAAFRCMSAALLRTQKKAQYYTALVFQENRQKGDNMWDNIVDVHSELCLTLDTSFKEVDAKFRQDLEAQYRRRRGMGQKKYLSSQFLADSSLQEDMEEMGSFTAAPEEAPPEKNKNNNSLDWLDTDSQSEEKTKNEKEEDGEDDKQEEIETIDLDPFNSNPCMETFMEVIDYMYENFSASHSSDKAPEWMKELLKVARDATTKMQVRWFIARMLVNRPVVFERYALAWFEPLVQVCVADENGGVGFHYFLRDIGYLFLRWTTFNPAKFSTCHDLAGLFIKKLMENAHDVGRAHESIMAKQKANMLLVKLLVEKWRDGLQLERALIIQQLKTPQDKGRGFDESFLRVLTSLQLIGVYLANNFKYVETYNSEEEVEEAVSTLLACLSNKRKHIQQLAGEVWGMLIKSFDHKSSLRNKFEARFRTQLVKLFKESQYELFLRALSQAGLWLHDQEFFDSKLLNHVSHLPTHLHGEFLVQALQILYWGAADMEDPHPQLLPLLTKVVNNQDAKAHEVALLIINRTIWNYTISQLYDTLSLLTQTCLHHPEPNCRALYFKLLMFVYDNHTAFNTLRKSGQEHAVVELVLMGLRKGLLDPDDSIRDTLLAFWDNAQRLPEELAARLLACFQELYDPTLQDEWVQYCTLLLLKPTSRSPDFSRPFSKQALEKGVTFQNVTIDSVLSTHRPFTPLFSQDGQEGGFYKQMDDDEIPAGYVRATQKNQDFSATQSLMSMNEEQLYDYNLSHQASVFRPTQSQSDGSAPVGSLAQFQQRLRHRPSSKHRLQQGRVEVKRASINSVIQRRFTQRAATDSVEGSQLSADYFKKSAETKSRYEQLWKARIKERASQQVTILRQYRRGELPDIQIQQKELLLPLQALHKDLDIAKNLFLILFKSIYSKLAVKKTEAEAAEARTKFCSVLLQAIGAVRPIAEPSASFLFVLHMCLLECAETSGSELLKILTVTHLQNIGHTAGKSRSYHSGIHLLERIVLLVEQKPEKPNGKSLKRKKVGGSNHTDALKNAALRQLASLYRELGENETVLLLIQETAKEDRTRKAIELELRGRFHEAMQVYVDLLNFYEEPPPGMDDEVDLWDDERLRCVYELADWTNLYDNIQKQVEEEPVDVYPHSRLDALWDKKYHGENAGQDTHNYLQSFIHSSLSLEEKRHTVLLPWVTRALQKEESRKILEETYALELARLYATEGDRAMAEMYLQKAYVSFLSVWGQLPVFAKGPRLRHLHKLQQMKEVSEFLDADPYTALPSGWTDMVVRVQNVARVWGDRYPHHCENSYIWDSLISSRSFYLPQLKADVERKTTEMLQDAKDVSALPVKIESQKQILQELRVKLCQVGTTILQNGAEEMARMGNFDVANRYLTQDLVSFSGRFGSGAQRLDRFLLDCTNWRLRAKCHRLEATDGVELYRKQDAIWNNMLKLEEKIVRKPDQVHPNPVHVYRWTEISADLLKEMGELCEQYPEIKVKENEHPFTEVDNILQDLASDLYDDLHAAGPSERAAEVDLQTLTELAPKAYLKYACWAYERICKHNEEKKRKDGKSSHVFSNEKEHSDMRLNFVRWTIEALKYDSVVREASRLIPRLLNLLADCERDDKAVHEFLVRSAGICDEYGKSSKLRPCKCARKDETWSKSMLPCWLFIPWLPQIMSVIDKPADRRLVTGLLLRLATAYPQAVFYPFNLTKERIQNAPAGVMDGAKKLVQEVEQRLDCKFLADFITALDCMQDPHLRFHDYWNNTRKAFQFGRRKEVQQLSKQYWESGLAASREGIGKDIGVKNSHFGKEFRHEMQEIFDRQLSKVHEMKLETFNKHCKELYESVKKYWGGKKLINIRKQHEHNLEYHSGWLSNFEEISSRFFPNKFIELPGQYTGLSEPHPELHVRIVSFNPEVLCMSSIRKPKRLTIHGNDEKDHNFLVKSGEDLRLDQRIQQLFVTMNQELAADPTCARRGFSTRTYGVIPLTTRLGIVEWCRNTQPVKSIIEMELLNHQMTMGTKLNEYIEMLEKLYQKETGKKLKKEEGAKLMRELLLNVEGSKIARAFTEFSETIPTNVLSKALFAHCSTPEAFLVVRARFAASFVTFNICSYILGIGDRHLDNFLLDTSDGSVIGIDFGHAFGSATSLLPVPELVPFRCVRQLQHLMSPLDTVALFKLDMATILRTLHAPAARENILTVMEVFVKEPHMEWVSQAKEKAKRDGLDLAASGEAGSGLLNYPMEKLARAKSKLSRANPAYILCEEVKENAFFKQEQEPVLKLLTGDPSRHVRARRRKMCESVEEQVECLIELATDPHILGCTCRSRLQSGAAAPDSTTHRRQKKEIRNPSWLLLDPSALLRAN